ncbi:WD40 repeat-like protein [Aaosphaeria arxii CBS 175.79]|uniref:WD40 repeat-like protein n=1 Tax=Aaosphaeria arxii CBS 175.79 TaxID=1450172 RepID=A0A6A5Y863_9PLEO|nr:WD40 repeat-like protein [Aaosphaeria arxii CBS 175.79]KAF2021782.1 WD40 repeat-like protein [Aaosphaeria arxii CBS 175.79]
MPFHSHHSNNAQQNSPAAGIFQAAQALGAIGAPTGNLRVASTGQTNAGTDALMPGSGNAPGVQSPTGNASSSQSHLVGGGQAPAASAPPQSNSSSYDPLRRAPTLRTEELHIPTSSHTPTTAQHHLQQQQQQQQQQLHQPQHQHLQQVYNSPDQYSTGSAPNIGLHQATPQASQYSNPPPPASAGVPGSLQAGNNPQQHLQLQQQLQQRPGPSSAYTAPSTVPTVPQINTNAQQYTLPTRSNTMSQSQHPSSHTYSRSSPAGLGPDQKYIPFSNTPENPNSKYVAGTPAQKYYPAGAASNSPLGLADIRPRANSNMEESAMVGGQFFNDSDRSPSNSNYLAPWPVYAFDWCKWNVPPGNGAGKMAVGSYLEDTHNFIQIIDTQLSPQDPSTPGAPSIGLSYEKIAEATCSYPVTRILWEPPSGQKQSTDLLATSGDHLRLWSLPSSAGSNISNTITRTSSVNTRDPAPQKLTPLALLSNSKTPEHTAPLTSLDWNTMSPKLIITSSIDTTCTIWDIPTLTAKTQLIAHDKEVFDVRFCAGSVDVFVSCGADGSVRMFDLRSLEHSTIIYEPSEKSPNDKDKGKDTCSPGRMSPTKAQQTMTYAPPLLRLAASPHDSHLLATFAADSSLIRILDVRQPGQALLELRGHSASVNSIEWNPSRRGMLASGGDDSLVLVWDLLHSQNGAVINSETPGSMQPQAQVAQQPINGGANQPTAGQGGTANQKGPYASWRCDYEVGNLSWAPQSALTGQGGEWVGVSGGRGIWGVKL